MTNPIMHDKHGFSLQIGDTITTPSLGEGRIIAYLSADTDGLGARVRIQNAKGVKVDLALKLAGAEYKEVEDAAARTTDQKYGV